MKTTIVYLIHFDSPFSHARHYLGSTNNLEERLEAHQKGQGATLTKEVMKAGIGMAVARIWKGDKNFERALKNRKEGPRLCPICNPKMKEHLHVQQR